MPASSLTQKILVRSEDKYLAKKEMHMQFVERMTNLSSSYETEKRYFFLK